MCLRLGQLLPSAMSGSTRPGEGSGGRQDGHQSLGVIRAWGSSGPGGHQSLGRVPVRWVCVPVAGTFLSLTLAILVVVNYLTG